MAIGKVKVPRGGRNIPMTHTIPRHHAYMVVIRSIASLKLEHAAYPRNVSVSLCVSPSISNILIVLSEEHVASRRP